MNRAGALRALTAACALALPLASTGVAERASAEDAPAWAYDLASDLMSPFCPGRTISDCPSPQAASLKAWIVVQAAAGRSREDVEAELYDRYGDVILAAPRSEGFGAAAYWIPVAVFLAGGALVAWFLRRSTTRTASPAPRLDPEAERKLDEVLGSGEVGPR